MKYTYFKEADKLVQNYLNIIVEEIKKDVPGLISIILAGGYGRGEGAVEFIEKKPRLINDIDIYLITKKQLNDSFLDDLGKKCSNLLGKGGLEYPENYNKKFDFDTFFNVDLRNITISRLKVLPPTVRYYEMKNSTILLYGEDIRKKIPEIKTEDIPFSEGLRFLSNRMMNLFLCMKEEFLKKSPSKDEIGIINYYISKAYLACCDSLLLSRSKFAPTYSGRTDLFCKIYKKEFFELYEKFPNLANRIKEAMNYKLNPDIKKINYKEEWFNVRYIITEIFLKILQENLPKNKINWKNIQDIAELSLENKYFEGYSSGILKRLKINFKVLRIFMSKLMGTTLSLLYFLKLNQEIKKVYFKALSLKDPGLKILRLTPLVLLSLNKEGTLKQDYIKTIEKKLNRLYPINRIDSWKSLKENYLKVYKLYYLRRFV